MTRATSGSASSHARARWAAFPGECSNPDAAGLIGLGHWPSSRAAERAAVHPFASRIGVMLTWQPAPRRARRRDLRPDCRISRPPSGLPASEPAFAGPILARPRVSLRHAPFVASQARSRRRRESDASLEVSFPFSARWPQRAVRGSRASGRSRFGVCSFTEDPRVHGPSPAKRRPCGFTLFGCEAVVLDARTNYRLRRRESQSAPP